MDLSSKVGYRLFLEKIFFGIKDIIIHDYKLFCFSSEGVSIWRFFNKNLIFTSFYDKETVEYDKIKNKVIKNDESG